MHRIPFIIILLAAASLQAANMAIGYIDSERILLESQDAIEAQKLFETESQAWDAQVADIERDIARLQEEYENKRLVLTDTGRAEAQQKIADKKAELDTLINSIYGENGLASQKNKELLEPVMEKLTHAIKKVADENDLQMVFDAAAGGLLYAIPSMDYTDFVIEQMNSAANMGEGSSSGSGSDSGSGSQDE